MRRTRTTNGCPPVNDNLTKTLAALLLYINNAGPKPEFDARGRPTYASVGFISELADGLDEILTDVASEAARNPSETADDALAKIRAAQQHLTSMSKLLDRKR